MSETFGPADIAPDERDLHAALAAARPAAPPVGFRDGVMRRLREDRRVAWEWIVAVLFAVPSVTYLVRQALASGEDLVNAMANVVTAASSETSDAFFFVDGLTVLALAFLGLACAVAAHALLVSGERRRVAR